MSTEKYTKTYLQEQLPAEIREHRREDNLDPTELPSYDYLKRKGFNPRGLNAALQRHFDKETTLHEFLYEQGFGFQNGNEWNTTHERTISLLNSYRDSRKKRNNDAPDTTATLESALRKIIQVTQQIHNTNNLLLFFQCGTAKAEHRRNKQIESIIDKLKNDLSGGAAENYVRYFKEFYDYVVIHSEFNENPIKKILWQYDFDTTPEKEVSDLDGDQIRKLWRTLKQLPERDDLCNEITGLVGRYGLEHWQELMMVLLVFGVGVGPRASDITRVNCIEHWNFGPDSYVYFPVRKNQPSEIPILARDELLKAHRDYMQATRENWNGKPFPSRQSESGSVSPTTLNRWLSSLSREAEVRLHNGSYPTLQNLRQTWHTRYMESLRKLDVRLRLVADDAGTKTKEIASERYWSASEKRKSIRDLISDDFDEFFPLDELPKAMADELDQSQYMNYQMELDEF